MARTRQPQVIARSRKPGAWVIDLGNGRMTRGQVLPSQNQFQRMAGPEGLAARSENGKQQTWLLGQTLAIGAGDFTFVTLLRTYASAVLPYSYLVGFNDNYFAPSLWNSNVGSYAALTIGGHNSSGIDCQAANLYRYSVVRRSGRLYWNINGARTDIACTDFVPSTDRVFVGAFNNGSSGYTIPDGSSMYLCALEARGWSDAEQQQYVDDPYGALFAPSRRVWVQLGPAAGGEPTAVTATLAATDGADAAAFAATHAVPAVTAALAATDGADAAAFAATHTVPAVTAALAATDGADAAAFVGESSATPVTATLAATDGADIAEFAATHQIAVTATMAATDGADIAAFAGTHIASVTAALAATDGADICAFAATHAQAIIATFAATEGADVATFTGRTAGISIWTDVGVSAATWSDVGPATSIWTDI